MDEQPTSNKRHRTIKELEDIAIGMRLSRQNMQADVLHAAIELLSPEPPVIHDRPLSASQRLHNICDALSDHLDESPFTREEWDAVDKETVRLQNRVKELEAEVSTLRDHLAEQNRLLSLNCREVERLRAAQPPKACTHPWEHVGINADGIYWCTECFAQLRVPSITDEDQRRVLPPLTKSGPESEPGSHA